jgi:hypothetical protein
MSNADSFFSSDTLRFGPWSPSKADSASKCGLKFGHQYTSKTKVPTDKIVKDLSDSPLRIGSAVHKYAELRAKKKSRESATRVALSNNRLVGEDKDAFTSMLESADALEDRLAKFRAKYNVTLDKAELRLGITTDLSKTGFFSDDVFLRGVIDRLIIIDGRFAIPIDIKTGKMATLRYSKLQLDIYSWLIFAHWPGVSLVHPALYFVTQEELLWHEKLKRDFLELSAEHTIVAALNSAAETAAGNEPGPGKHCDWCAFRNLCPAT